MSPIFLVLFGMQQGDALTGNDIILAALRFDVNGMYESQIELN